MTVEGRPNGATGAASSKSDLLAAVRAARRDIHDVRHASRKHAALAQALSTAGDKAEALEVLEEARRLGGGLAEDLEALGFAAFNLNAHELSRVFYNEVVRLAPGDALARYNLATSERNLGHLDAAEAACTEALERDPQLFQAILLRSQLRTQEPGANHVAELLSALRQQGEATRGQIFLNYALGKEYDDLGDYASAFAHFRRGALARRNALSYSVERDVEILRRIQMAYPRPRGCVEPSGRVRYGFVLGMPRSGTTVIERVLTGNPEVHSNGETDNFSTALMRNLASSSGDVIMRAAEANREAVGTAYRALAGAPAVGGLILEKLPLNYLYVGAIHESLPDARVVLVLRHPLDNGLGMFTTLFGAAYPFSYDLAELGTYLAAYRRLVDHWIGEFGDRLLVVPYEAFVDQPALWGERIAQFMDLNWDPAHLNIQANKTPSATASAVQVRRPISRTAVGRWRHYASHLTPLAAALRANGVDFDTDQ